MPAWARQVSAFPAEDEEDGREDADGRDETLHRVVRNLHAEIIPFPRNENIVRKSSVHIS